MKSLIPSIAAAALLIISIPAAAAPFGAAPAFEQPADTAIDKRRKARIKGGSGCDDAGDAIEHPECR